MKNEVLMHVAMLQNHMGIKSQEMTKILKAKYNKNTGCELTLEEAQDLLRNFEKYCAELKVGV